MRAGPATVGAAALVIATGCAGGPSAGFGEPSTPSTVQLDERSDGKTVDVPFGSKVAVTLHSTYWQLDVPDRALQPVGAPQTSPSRCSVAGSGCGTVTMDYNAAKIGTTVLHAHRDTCGEALRCTGKNGEWSVTVRVR